MASDGYGGCTKVTWCARCDLVCSRFEQFRGRMMGGSLGAVIVSVGGGGGVWRLGHASDLSEPGLVWFWFSAVGDFLGCEAGLGHSNDLSFVF